MTDADDLAEALRLLRLWDLSIRKGHQEWPLAETAALLARHPEPVKLKPCPWCGGLAEIAAPNHGSRMRRGNCHNCQVYGPWGTDEADAIAAWNRRALG